MRNQLASFARPAANHVLEMFNYARGIWEARRAEPENDLATLIAHAAIDGDELDVIDFNMFFLLLIDAGCEVRGTDEIRAIEPRVVPVTAEDWDTEYLIEDVDARLATAVEELLRWVSPVVYMRRTAQRDTELAGVRIATVSIIGIARPGQHEHNVGVLFDGT